MVSPFMDRVPEDKCDVTSIEHIDYNWIGCQNDDHYVLVIMNHKEALTVAVRPHEAHLDVYARAPRLLVGTGREYRQVPAAKRGVQYLVSIPPNQTAFLIWDRLK